MNPSTSVRSDSTPRATPRLVLQLVIGKHLIGDNGDVSLNAQPGQRVEIGPRMRLPVGLFGLTTSSARVRGESARSTLRQVHRPAPVIFESIRPDAGHAVQSRRVLEQRITRLRNQHFVSWIAQHLEQQRVRLTGAGRQRNPAGIHMPAAPREVGGNGRAGFGNAERFGSIGETTCMRQRREQVRRIAERGARRIRLSEVEDWPTLGMSGARPPGRVGSTGARAGPFPKTSRQDLDGLDDIAFENPVDDVHAVQHLREHRISVVVAGVVDQVDEDLRRLRCPVRGSKCRSLRARGATGRPRHASTARRCCTRSRQGCRPGSTPFGTTRWNVRPL